MTDPAPPPPERPTWLPTAARVRQLVWDAGAVLAAILVAFALDAWWDARVEHTSMLDALDAVAAEIEQNLELLDSAVALNERQIETAQDFAALSPQEIAALPEAEVYRYWGFPNHEILTLKAGAITAFVEGGFLQAVDDDALRAEIAGIATLQEELDEEREGFRAFDEEFTIAVFATAPLSGLGGSSGPEDLRETLRSLVESEEARRFIYGRAFLLGIYTEEMRRLRGLLEETQRRIEPAMDP